MSHLSLVMSHESQTLSHLVMRPGLRTYSPSAASYSWVLLKRSCWTLHTARRCCIAPSSGGTRRCCIAPSSGSTWSCTARPCPAGLTPEKGTPPGGSRGRRRSWSPVGTVWCGRFWDSVWAMEGQCCMGDVGTGFYGQCRDSVV